MADLYPNLYLLDSKDELAQTLLESISDGVMVVGEEGSILLSNRAYQVAHGIGRDWPMYRDAKEMTERVDLFTLDGAELPMEEWPFMRALRGEPVTDLQLRCSRADGSRSFVARFSTRMVQIERRRAVLIVLRDITQEARFKEETEQFLRRVLDNLFAFVGVLDLDGTLIQANKAPLEAAGIPPEQVIGKKFWDCYWWSYSADEQLRLKQSIERALAGQVVRYDVQVLMAGGTLMWIDFQLAPLRDSTGTITHLVPSGMDLTARKEAEKLVIESEQRFRATFETAAVGIGHLSLQGKWLRLNETYSRILGYSPEELHSLTFSEITHPDDIAADVALSKQLVSGEIPYYTMDKRYIRSDGSIVWVNLTASLVRKEDGAPDYFVAVVRDVGARKAFEFALEESEGRFRALADNIDQLAWVANRDGYITWYNRRWYEYTGAQPQDMEGWGWQSVHDAKFLPGVMKRWTRSIETGDPFEMQFPLRGADGKFRTFLTRVRPIKNEQGEVVQWFGTNTDIQVQKEMEEELERRVLARTAELQEANRELEAFTYSVAHDLRAPLRAINSSSRILVEDLLGTLAPEHKALLERQVFNSKKLAELIDDLLKLSSIVRQSVKRGRVDLSQLARELVNNGLCAEAQNNEFLIEDGLVATGDEELLKLVLWNLFENACKYSPEGGTVRIGKLNQQGEEVFFVEDRGIGFDMQYAAKIFQPFERLVRDEHFPGTGIGLANAHRIVAKHGGKIWAESTPGDGATFYFTLPEVLAEHN